MPRLSNNIAQARTLTTTTIVGLPLATWMDQTVGWRNADVGVAALGALLLVALWSWIPRSAALNGGPVLQELQSLKEPPVWAMVAVAAMGVASMFAVYTFIGPIVTKAARLHGRWVSVALALSGISMTVGNAVGGRLADRHLARGLLAGFGSALVALALQGRVDRDVGVLTGGLFAVSGTTIVAIPTIQVRLTRAAPQAPAVDGRDDLLRAALSQSTRGQLRRGGGDAHSALRTRRVALPAQVPWRLAAPPADVHAPHPRTCKRRAVPFRFPFLGPAAPAAPAERTA